MSCLCELERIFGKEIVGDGCVCKIEKGLVGGCKVRIIGVLGGGGKKGRISKGEECRVLEEDEIELGCGIGGEVEGCEVMKFSCGGSNVRFGLVSKGYGDGIGCGERFKVGFCK